MTRFFKLGEWTPWESILTGLIHVLSEIFITELLGLCTIYSEVGVSYPLGVNFLFRKLQL